MSALKKEISQILLRYDLAGCVVQPEHQADEYDSEAEEICFALANCPDKAALQRIIYNAMTGMFWDGVTSLDKCMAPADEIWALYQGSIATTGAMASCPLIKYLRDRTKFQEDETHGIAYGFGDGYIQCRCGAVWDPDWQLGRYLYDFTADDFRRWQGIIRQRLSPDDDRWLQLQHVLEVQQGLGLPGECNKIAHDLIKATSNGETRLEIGVPVACLDRALQILSSRGFLCTRPRVPDGYAFVEIPVSW
jgi:hypothetical protein